MSKLIHVWEQQGIGRAPFTCVGLYSVPSKHLAEFNPSAYSAELARMPSGYDIGSCAVCGVSLTNNFLIKANCGRTFSVGCDCVKKSGDSGLIDAIQAEKRKRARSVRQSERQAAIQSNLDSQRIRNGGLTDWELQEIKRARLEALKAANDQANAAAINLAIQPILNALSTKSGSFAAEMIELMNNGQLPTGRARDICCAIFGEYHAMKTTGKSKGIKFKGEKITGMGYAHGYFNEAESALKLINISCPLNT